MSILPSHKPKIDKKIDNIFGINMENFDLGVISNLPLGCHSALLPHLAASFDVNITGLSEHAARKLIQSAFEIHYYSGTFYSLNKAIETRFDHAVLQEWSEYGGSPYHFKISVDMGESEGIGFGGLALASEIIEKYKNVRSVCDGVELNNANFITPVPAIASFTTVIISAKIE